jgi:hypothetical protein
MRIPHSNAHLPHATKSFFDQPPVPIVEGLVTPDEESRWFLGIERGAQPREHLLYPILWRALIGYPPKR